MTYCVLAEFEMVLDALLIRNIADHGLSLIPCSTRSELCSDCPFNKRIDFGEED